MKTSGALSLAEARRLALHAQGFGGVSDRPPERRALLALLRRLGVLQIDSVNVLVRSHYLPLFSRLGSYDRAALDALAYGPRRRLFEYWGHEASLLPLEAFPLLRWRMNRARARQDVWPSIARIAQERPRFLASLEAAIRTGGPASASDFENARGSGSWWGWSDVKRGLEFLFAAGVLTTRSRRPSFERVYDLTERVVPAALLAATVDEADAQRELVRLAARALGIATETDLRDYFRLAPRDTRARVGELVAQGELAPIAVDGWSVPAYLEPGRPIPRRLETSALLSPFDPIVWHRPRAERLFAFTYRLEIYTPSPKRVYGYYVLPYVLGDALVARVDLKADRAAGVLRVLAIHYEERVERSEVVERLRVELAALAQWLGLETTAFPVTRAAIVQHRHE